jgi:hypothetical protein
MPQSPRGRLGPWPCLGFRNRSPLGLDLVPRRTVVAPANRKRRREMVARCTPPEEAGCSRQRRSGGQNVGLLKTPTVCLLPDIQFATASTLGKSGAQIVQSPQTWMISPNLQDLQNGHATGTSKTQNHLLILAVSQLKQTSTRDVGSRVTCLRGTTRRRQHPTERRLSTWINALCNNKQ